MYGEFFAALKNSEREGFRMNKYQPRNIDQAKTYDDDLGPLKLLPGKWKSLPEQGWNMIALPFAAGEFNYRVMVNAFKEELAFSIVDKAIPNRGLGYNDCGAVTSEADQFLSSLNYEQTIEQTDSADFPESGLVGTSGLTIHHEPGLWLHMSNETTDGFDIARLALIPHGNSVLALGKSTKDLGSPNISMFKIRGLPMGAELADLDINPYLEPYKHFHDNPFKGVFDPTQPTALLSKANESVTVVRTTTLEVDTENKTGGIKNIPFITKQANADAMKSTFWIQELAKKDKHGKPKLRLQYAQVVILEFFPRPDRLPGLAKWPHVSINTLEKVDDD